MADEAKGKRLFDAIEKRRTNESLKLITDPTTDINWSNPYFDGSRS